MKTQLHSPRSRKLLTFFFKVVVLLTCASVTSAQQTEPQSGTTDRLSFGSIDIKMASTSVSETNSLLRSILSQTVTFLDASFSAAKDYVFRNVACSIVSYQLGGGADSNGIFYANVTIGGFVHFQPDSGVDQMEVLDLAATAFGKNGFLDALVALEDEAFLQNLQSITLSLNGRTLLDAKRSVDGDGNEFENVVVIQDDTDAATRLQSTRENRLSVWMVATIAGAGAFMCVICIAFACMCCIPRDRRPYKKHSRKTKKNKPKKKALGVVTIGNSDPTDSDDIEEEKTPSPARSLMSQDSSVFTYNPKSVCSKVRSDNNNNNDTDDEESPKSNPWKAPHGLHRTNKNLSLIEECSENSSEQSTPRGKSQPFESGHLTNLLTSPISTGPEYDFESAYNPLTEESIRELEWAAERSLAFNTKFDENCSPFQKCTAVAFPGDEDADGFFFGTKKQSTE